MPKRFAGFARTKISPELFRDVINLPTSHLAPDSLQTDQKSIISVSVRACRVAPRRVYNTATRQNCSVAEIRAMVLKEKVKAAKLDKLKSECLRDLL